MGKDFGKFEEQIGGSKENFCSWLTHECTGHWPGELPKDEGKEFVVSEKSKAVHNLSVECVGGSGPKLKAMCEHIKSVANPGHSFKVTVCPGEKDNEKHFGIDGDGGESIGKISMKCMKQLELTNDQRKDIITAIKSVTGQVNLWKDENQVAQLNIWVDDDGDVSLEQGKSVDDLEEKNWSEAARAAAQVARHASSEANESTQKLPPAQGKYEGNNPLTNRNIRLDSSARESSRAAESFAQQAQSLHDEGSHEYAGASHQLSAENHDHAADYHELNGNTEEAAKHREAGDLQRQAARHPDHRWETNDSTIQTKPQSSGSRILFGGRSVDGLKIGRTLSRKHENLIKESKGHVDDVLDEAELKRGHKAQLSKASEHLGVVLDAVTSPNPQGEGDMGNQLNTFTVGKAAETIIKESSKEERDSLRKAMDALDLVDKQDEKTAEYRKLIGEPEAKAKREDDDEDKCSECGKDVEPDKDGKCPECGAKMEKSKSFTKGSGGEGPSQYDDGDLHQAHHKGRKMLTGKAVQSYLVQKCGMTVKSVADNHCVMDHSGKEVAAFLVKKGGFAHKYFTEEEDKKSAGKKRVDAFVLGKDQLKATSVYTVGGQKACQVFMSKPSKKPDDDESGEKPDEE
jgi:rubrerythrin